MIGNRLGGRYEIIERVGGGGMAVVYKGQDILLHRHVAVKVLRSQYVHDEEFIHRFRREAQAAASLSHPNVVSIYDVGQQEDVHYIVMEYIEGTTLNDLIKEKAPLQIEEAVHIASQICDALDHAHHNQIIHRDIKPHNILIGRNGRVKVTDFGIARAVTSSTITQTGSVVGSVHYFSPEHAKGTSAGEQSDLYSLGIVMYQMLTAKLPFHGESPISVALKHLQEDVEDPRNVNPLIPQSVENIVLKAMRKSVSERYRSAKEMLEDLESCLLPQRRGEPKISFLDHDELDEERTRVMPAIRPEQLEEYAPQTSDVQEGAEESSKVKAPGGAKRWKKPLIWSAVLLVCFIGLWFAAGYVKNLIIPAPDVNVPPVVTLHMDEASQKITEAGLVPKIVLEPHAEVQKDVVFRQDPEGIMVKPGREITLYVSEGPKLEKMPELTGSSLTESKLTLAGFGITGDERIQMAEEFLDEEPGTVVKQTPAPGTDIDPLSVIVKLTVSKGRETSKMPELVGLTELEANNTLKVNNLKLGTVNRVPSYKQPQGRVIEQHPYKYNADVPPGAEIDLVISSGLPEDAGEMAVTIPVQPAVPGQPSSVEIILSDAVYDEMSYLKLDNVTDTRNVEVKLVVSPDKDATIIVMVDGVKSAHRTVTYHDYMERSGISSVPASGTPADSTESDSSSGSAEQQRSTNQDHTNEGAGAGQSAEESAGGSSLLPPITIGGSNP